MILDHFGVVKPKVDLVAFLRFLAKKQQKVENVVQIYTDKFTDVLELRNVFWRS